MDARVNKLYDKYSRASKRQKWVMRFYWTIKGNFVSHKLKKFPPVFIIGAPRSGTTLLFQILKTQEKFSPLFEPTELWEISFGFPNDDTYCVDISTPDINCLLGLFASMQMYGRPHLLSKDPRDSLRVLKINEFFPEARFIHIIRDGRDVVSSINEIWQGTKYRVDREFDWVHVRIPNYRAISDKPAYFKAAKMWSVCVESVHAAFENISRDRYLTVKYEDLVRNPVEEIQRVFSFLFEDYDMDAAVDGIRLVSNKVDSVQNIVGGIGFPQQWVKTDLFNDAGSGTMSKSNRIGKWSTVLKDYQMAEITPLISPMMEQYDYYR